MCTTATMRSRNPSLYDASPLSAPPWADRGGKTPDPSLGGVCQFLWPQHSHHRAGSVRTRGSLLRLQRPRPGGEGVVTTAAQNKQPLNWNLDKSNVLIMWCVFLLQWNPGWCKAVSQQAVHRRALVQTPRGHMSGLVFPGLSLIRLAALLRGGIKYCVCHNKWDS